MMPIEPVTLSLGAALLLGLSFGSGPCNIACLPYLGPVFVATGDTPRNAWRRIVPFSMGRLSGYALLAGAAGWAGVLVRDWIEGPWVRWVLGGATIVVALSLLWRRHANRPMCASHTTGQRVTLPPQPDKSAALPGGLFMMGMALNPCAPLGTIILAAATTASIFNGLQLGLSFGLGAVLLPSLIFTFGVAHFGSQLRDHIGGWRNALENTSIALLVVMGSATAIGWIAP